MKRSKWWQNFNPLFEQNANLIIYETLFVWVYNQVINMGDLKQTMQAGLSKHGFITSLGIGVKINLSDIINWTEVWEWLCHRDGQIFKCHLRKDMVSDKNDKRLQKHSTERKGKKNYIYIYIKCGW